MALPEKYRAKLIVDTSYHIYNRTNNKELLFRNDENKKYFLRKFHQFLGPYLHVISYSLLPNHFHFTVQTKTSDEITNWLKQKDKISKAEREFLNYEITATPLFDKAFHQFFTSYATSYNKMFKRKGNLFHRPFKRIKVDSGSHLNTVTTYIHVNAQKHGIIKDFRNYTWSSWNDLINNKYNPMYKPGILDDFGGLDKFIQAHMDFATLLAGTG